MHWDFLALPKRPGYKFLPRGLSGSATDLLERRLAPVCSISGAESLLRCSSISELNQARGGRRRFGAGRADAPPGESPLLASPRSGGRSTPRDLEGGKGQGHPGRKRYLALPDRSHADRRDRKTNLMLSVRDGRRARSRLAPVAYLHRGCSAAAPAWGIPLSPLALPAILVHPRRRDSRGNKARQPGTAQISKSSVGRPGASPAGRQVQRSERMHHAYLAKY